MKIQIVSWRDPLNPRAGGAEVCLLEISRRLIADFGHDVSWFAPAFERGAVSEVLDGIAIERRGRFAAIHLEAARRFFRRRRQTADLYLEDYHGLTLGLRWFLGKPHVILVHEVAGPIWLAMWKFPISWTGYGLEKLTLRLLRRAHFIAVSPSTKEDLVAHGIPPERIFTITEGSDIPAVAQPKSRVERAQRFVFVGRICMMKRVDLLLRAFAKHRALCPTSKLVLVGAMDENFRTEFDALLAELAVGAAVELAGRVSQARKAELLGDSLALVSCSMREGFGLIVVEASSQGTPSLTFDVNGYRDLVEPGKNGYMVAFPDLDALAARMRDIVVMDAAPYEELCRSALAISMRYSWDHTATDIDRILTQITRSKNEA